MFGWQGCRNALSIFKWRKPSDPSLSTGLLNDISPEIELSGYGRSPSPGSESPSGLLNGESLKVEPIADLDLFFERLYSYYCEKGLWCIIVKWIVELLSLAFTICFSGFFLLYVDWDGLRNAKCGMDAVESGTKLCDLAKEALHEHPLTPLTLHKAIILGYLCIFSTYWVFGFLRFFAQLKETLRIRHFYYNCLHVVRVQSSQKLCVVKDLSAHEIIMRLMRKENYLIGMINKGILAFPISKWIPGAGPNKGRQRLILTKTLEWTLNWSILQSMFDRKFCIRGDFVANPGTLRKRLVVVGLAMLLLSPFLVIFMLIFGRNLFWYAAVFGTITAVSRAAVTDELLVLDPEGTMSLVVQHTHYMRKRWRGKENTEMVRMEFETLFQYTAMMWLEEMASIFLTPYLLIFVVPKQVNDILQFITEFTVYVDGVGDVCSFQTSYPSWQPDDQGMQFLTTLRTFRDEKLRGRNPGYMYSLPRWQQSPSFRDQNNFRRESPYNSPRSGCHLGSLWLIENDPKTHPYLLDWFYLSGARRVLGNATDVPTLSLDIDNKQSNDYWMPSLNDEAVHGDSWPNFFDNRAGSHLEASTSSPVFLEEQSVLRHNDSRTMLPSSRSHWWARGGSSSVNAEPQQGSFLEPPEFRHYGWPEQASFLEPPEFNHHNANEYYESHSEKSIDEQEQQLGWGNYHKLSSMTYPNDLGTSGGEFKLHFDDIFKPPEPLTLNLDPRDIV
ncbi:Autophagy-related protein 9 [Bienertia sinuspersici]